MENIPITIATNLVTMKHYGKLLKSDFSHRKLIIHTNMTNDYQGQSGTKGVTLSSKFPSLPLNLVTIPEVVTSVIFKLQNSIKAYHLPVRERMQLYC